MSIAAVMTCHTSVLLPHLFSMASMFLRSRRTCRELPSSLSEKSRWWPVMHRVPLLGGCSGCWSTTSATLAVLMCSENSISSPPPLRQNLQKRNHALLNFCCGLQITSSPLVRKWKRTPSSVGSLGLGRTADALCLFDDKESINRIIFFLYIVRFYTLSHAHVAENETALRKKETTENGSARFLRNWNVSHIAGKSFWTLWATALMRLLYNKWPLDGSTFTRLTTCFGLVELWKNCLSQAEVVIPQCVL